MGGGGRECRFIIEPGHDGRHLRVYGLETFAGPPKQRPLWGGGGSLEGVGAAQLPPGDWYSSSPIQHHRMNVQGHSLHAPSSGSDGLSE